MPLQEVIFLHHILPLVLDAAAVVCLPIGKRIMGSLQSCCKKRV